MIDILSVVLGAAGGAAADTGSPMGFIFSLLPWIGIFGIFWFLIFRPQMKKQKEHQAKITGLKKGDQVVTQGGLVGKVAKVDDNYVEIDLAKDVRVKAVKHTIGDIIPPGGKAAND